MEFRYSRFYVIQPVGGFVYVGLILAAVLYWNSLHTGQKTHQVFSWLLIISFLLFVMIKAIFYFIEVMKGPVLFRLGEESISAVYRDGRVDQIFWRDIKSIRSCRNPWRGMETIEITFKDGSERTLCNNLVKKYKAFKLAMSDAASNKVAVVKLMDNGKRKSTRKKA